MFIIFSTETGQIFSSGRGTPTESQNKLYLGTEVICNDLTKCSWKFIADQPLETTDEGYYEHTADYYDSITQVPSNEDRLAAVEQYLLEKELGL